MTRNRKPKLFRIRSTHRNIRLVESKDSKRTLEIFTNSFISTAVLFWKYPCQKCIKWFYSNTILLSKQCVDGQVMNALRSPRDSMIVENYSFYIIMK